MVSGASEKENFYIILPVYGATQLTKRFIDSCACSSNDKFALQYNIVDDSPGGEHRELSSYNGVFIISGTGELLWGGGINWGLAFLKSNFMEEESDLVVFANNDVLISQGCLQILSELVLDSSNLVIHPALTDIYGLALSPGSKLISWFPSLTKLLIDHDKGILDADFLSARFLTFHRSLLKKIHGIPLSLPHYGGDNAFTHPLCTQHRHRGINYVTPEQRHEGLDVEILAKPHALCQTTRAQNSQRWSGETRNWDRPKQFWLNPERQDALAPKGA